MSIKKTHRATEEIVLVAASAEKAPNLPDSLIMLAEHLKDNSVQYGTMAKAEMYWSDKSNTFPLDYQHDVATLKLTFKDV